MNYEMLGLFPVPLIVIKFKDHHKYDFPEVEKKDNKPYNWVDSVNTSFPIIKDDDPIISPIVRDNLKRDLKDSIVEVFRQLNFPTNIDFLELWYNIYHDNQGQEKHDHSSHVGQTVPFWSGIYYNKNASPTEFFKFNSTITDTQKFDGYRESALASCLAKSVSPDAKDGDILLFPPYLKHSVKSKPQHKNEMRMTFSFNITLNS